MDHPGEEVEQEPAVTISIAVKVESSTATVASHDKESDADPPFLVTPR
jgi:hypothetical protein